MHQNRRLVEFSSPSRSDGEVDRSDSDETEGLRQRKPPLADSWPAPTSPSTTLRAVPLPTAKEGDGEDIHLIPADTGRTLG